MVKRCDIEGIVTCTLYECIKKLVELVESGNNSHVVVSKIDFVKKMNLKKRQTSGVRVQTKSMLLFHNRHFLELEYDRA